MRVGRQAQLGPDHAVRRLFTPGTDAGGGYPMIPAWAGNNAYRRSGYVRRFHDAQRSDDGIDMFQYVFIHPLERMRPPPHPDTDIVAGLGRDIPSRVRDWALTADRPAGEDRVAPAWVLAELLRFPD